VTKVQYSSDSRIKTEVKSVDVDSLLQRLMSVNIRSYKYTDEWRQVRDDVSDDRVRGLIVTISFQLYVTLYCRETHWP